MSKITLTDLVNLENQTTAVNAINSNNEAIEDAFEKTLSRDGTYPNQMSANLDMNSNRILNLPVPTSNGEPIRKGDLVDFEQFQNSVDLAAALVAAQASADDSEDSAIAAAASAVAAQDSADDSETSAIASEASAVASAASAAQAASFVSSNAINIFTYIPSAEIPAIQARTSTYDAGPVINTAISDAAGAPLYFPRGTYRIDTQIKYKNPAASSLTFGPNIYGDGLNQTIFQSTVAGTQLTSTFSTTNGSVIVTVNYPSHPFSVGDVLTLYNLGSSSYGGLNMEGSWSVASVATNSFTFNSSGIATSTVVNTGTATVTKPTFEFDTAGAFMLGMKLRGFTVTTTGSPVGSTGIRFRRSFQGYLDDILIANMTADGLQVPCVAGDSDSTATLKIGAMRVQGCQRWGIDMAAGASYVGPTLTGYNEISNTILENVTIDTCGTGQTSYLRGGGMKWKGQGIHFESFACVTSSNCALFIPGGAGTASGVTFNFLVCENNTGRQCVIEGLDTLVGNIFEIYSNDSFVATTGLFLNATTSVVRNINIQASIVRATAGNNPYTAFVGQGANLGTVRIVTPSFQNFGHAGQTQSSGITFWTT